MKKFHTYFLILIFFLINSCDGGLEPISKDKRSYLKIELIFLNGKDNWPNKDSVIAVRVAAFKKIPDSSIIVDVIQGNAYFTLESLPLFVDSSFTTFEIIDAPVELKYIAAVMQYDSLITSQRVIGVYTKSGNNKEYSSLYIEKGKNYNIKINIDFNDLPPMPF